MRALFTAFGERAAAVRRAFVILGLLACATVTLPSQEPLGLADAIDSLRLEALNTRLAQAEEEVRITGFWRRVIPDVTISASFGLRNVFFIDPATLNTIVYPRDAYRLALSLSLSEVLFSPRHAAAQLRLEQVQQEYAMAQREIERRRVMESRRLEGLGGYLREELALNEELVRYDSLRFQQGTISFDAFVQSKLRLLRIRNAVRELHDGPADSSSSER